MLEARHDALGDVADLAGRQQPDHALGRVVAVVDLVTEVGAGRVRVARDRVRDLAPVARRRRVECRVVVRRDRKRQARRPTSAERRGRVAELVVRAVQGETALVVLHAGEGGRDGALDVLVGVGLDGSARRRGHADRDQHEHREAEADHHGQHDAALPVARQLDPRNDAVLHQLISVWTPTLGIPVLDCR